MTPTHKILVALNTRVCDATVPQVMAGLAAVAVTLAIGLGFVAFAANLGNF